MSQENIGYLLKQLSDRLSAVADASLREHGLTFSQLRVLEFIHRQGGEVTQKEIEDFLAVAHPTVVGLVCRLEKKGFLRCRVDETDRRNKRVSLSESAYALQEIMMQERLEMEAHLSKGFSQEELAQLRIFFRRLYQNME